MPDARIAIHAALTAVMAWLGTILALQGDRFDMGTSWHMLARHADEGTWSIVFWAVAGCGLVGLLTRRAAVRLCAVLVLATAHGALALSFLVSNLGGSGSGTYGILAGLGYYLAWRRSVEGV